MNPSLLRSRLIATRRNLPPDERLERSRAICRHIIHHPRFDRARNLACYLAVGGEADLHAVMEEAWAMGKRLYLPVLSPLRHNRLWFAPWDGIAPLRRNRFGIPEPLHTWRETIPPQMLDLVIAPLVAFDAECHRMGMGGGFYDRTFAFLLHRRHWRKPWMLGAAYEFQQVERISTRRWDVPIDAVATERGIHSCKR